MGRVIRPAAIVSSLCTFMFPFYLLFCLSALCQPFADAPHGFCAIFVGAKGGQTEKSFATGAEAYAGRAHHVGFVEHLFEEAPGTDAIRRFQPEVRGMVAAFCI